MSIGGIEEKDAISKLSLNMKQLVVMIDNKTGNYHMFACKSLEEVDRLDRAIKMSTSYQKMQAFAMDVGYSMERHYLDWMIDSCITQGMVFEIEDKYIANSKGTMILKKLLSNSQVVDKICFKGLRLSQEQIAIIQSLLECVDSDQIKMLKFEE